MTSNDYEREREREIGSVAEDDGDSNAAERAGVGVEMAGELRLALRALTLGRSGDTRGSGTSRAR